MKGNKRQNTVSLYKRIFLYLIGATLLAVVTLGSFWIGGKLVRYEQEVKMLRQTYSDSKKREIRNIILEIKDYIIWVQSNPKNPVAAILKGQVGKLRLEELYAGSDKDVAGYDELPGPVKDSLKLSRVPVYVISSRGKQVFSFNPFPARSVPDPQIQQLMNRIKESEKADEGCISIFRNSGADSVLIAAAYYNRKVIPGFCLASVVGPSDIENILKVQLLDSISRLRYEENEYVFINTMDGKALITHGVFNNPPKDILNTGDTAWVSIFRAQQSSALHPEGVYHKYSWALLTRPGTSGKTSYFSYIPSWKWIIGMGFYEDDVNKVIAARRDELRAELESTVLNILLFLAIAALLCFIVVRYFSKQIEHNINLFRNFFERAAKENRHIDKSDINYREFVFMADSANLMVEEKKNVEEALKESELHYRYLFEQNPVPLLIYETGSMRILSINEAFIKHYGFTREEVLTMTMGDLCTEEEKPIAFDLVTKLRGLAYVGEWHHIKKDGSHITVEITSHGFLHEGHSSRIAVINDITNRKKVEDQIRNLNANLELKVEERTALLEAANKELEAFSYSVSHDLRAPLRHINGFLELLIKRNYDSIDEKGRHYVDSISKASTHMGLLIDSLLNFSRTGRMEMKLDYLNMNQVVKDALAMLEQETDGRNIEWKVSPMPDVYADYAMMRQVWVNLLSNAIKYTRRCDVAVIEIGGTTEGDENIFYVRDNGTGFNMDYAQKLFGVFQRLHTNDEYEGTGIGLANVRQVINRHNGRTWAEGEVGKGAAFYFSLPVQ